MADLVFPTDVAAWIRTVVLPARYLASIPDPATCDCQGSASGHCQTGRHEQCPRARGWHRHGEPSPETYVVARRYGALAPVWRTSRACRWLCPCTCHTTVNTLFDAPARQYGRRSAGALRISSTDRLHRDDAPQPALFEVTS